MEATPSTLTVELTYEPEYRGYTARIPDIPAAGDGATEEEALADLQNALRGYVEAYGFQRTLASLRTP